MSHTSWAVTLSDEYVQHFKPLRASVSPFPHRLSLLSSISFQTSDQVSWRSEMEGTMAVHCRIDREKVPLRLRLQEVRKNHAKLPREKWADLIHSLGLKPLGWWCWFQASSPTSGGTQNPRGFSCLQEHTFKVPSSCQISIKTRIFSNLTDFIL